MSNNDIHSVTKARVAYIASAKMGLPSFVHREIDQLMKGGVEIFLFIVKYGPGIYMPQENWNCYVLKPVVALLRQPLFFVKRPLRYTLLLWEAIKTQSLVDFAIAVDFVPRMKEKKVDIIHCQEALHMLYIGYYCKQFLNTPLSVATYDNVFYVSPNANMAMLKRSLQCCDQIITNCDFNSEQLMTKFGVNGEKLHVVRSSVDTTKFHHDKSTKVLIVSQFAERKGHDVMLKALKVLARDDIVLWVVGAGSWSGSRDYVDVRRIAQEVGISDKVIFFGEVPETILRILYETCDIFCLPSRISSEGLKEGFPVALMEAMSYEKPVISTRHAGIPELVDDILVDENDVEGLAEAIERLTDDPDLRRESGKRNREIIERRYSTKNVTRLQELFCQMKGKGEKDEYA